MAEGDSVIAAALTLELFPKSIREAIIVQRGCVGQFGLPVSTTVTFLPDGNKFLVEGLYACGVNAFEGIEDFKYSDAESQAVWTVRKVDQNNGTFVLFDGDN